MWQKIEFREFLKKLMNLDLSSRLGTFVEKANEKVLFWQRIPSLEASLFYSKWLNRTISYSGIGKENNLDENGIKHEPWEQSYVFQSAIKGVLRGVEYVHVLFLFSFFFRENVVATCKIGSFLCSLDNLLQKNVIVFFFGNQISKWRSFEKKAIFDPLFTFFSHQEKLQKFHLYISHSHTYTYFAHPIDFFALPIKKKKEFIRYGFSLV